MRSFFLACLVAALLPSHAQTIISLNNPNFDNDILLEGAWSATVSGWQTTGSAGYFNPTETQYPTDDQTRANVGFANNGSLYQVTSEILSVNTEYTLTLEVGRRFDLGAQIPITLRFVAAGEVLAQAGGYAINPGEWRTVTLKMVASAAHPLGELLEVHLISTDVQTNFDNLSLTKLSVNQPSEDQLTLIGEDASIYVERNSTTTNNGFNSLYLKNNGRAFSVFEDTSQSKTWFVGNQSRDFFINDSLDGEIEFRLRENGDLNLFGDLDLGGNLQVGSSISEGNVQVGGAPTRQGQLSVVGEDGSVSIERNGATVNNNQTTLNLMNNGRVFIGLEDTSQSKLWYMGNQSNSFFINDSGDGEIEFRLFPNGNLDLNGVVTEMSDRNAKENIQSIIPGDVLSRVLSLPLSTWNYIDTEDHVRHLGPMAQDFHKAFGLNGDDTGITSLDTAGVALGAIQGLHQVIEEKDAKIGQLESLLSEVTDLLSAQEARLKNLEAALLK